jgi:hypothetical protein
MESFFDLFEKKRVINERRYVHKYNEKIPESYRTCSFHIAIEKADINKDWDVFRELIKIDPVYLKNHLDNTSAVFDYNYLKLTKDEQKELFRL